MGSATGIQPPDKDQLELLKLKAEAEKAQAERDKAVEEARQAKGLFAQLGKVFTPVVAALTIIFGYLAATHSQRVAEADLKVAKAELEKQRLEVEASSTKQELSQAKDTLTDTRARISAANTARVKAEAEERNTKGRLSGLQKEYRNLQAAQTQQITLGNLRKLIDILDSEPPERQTADSRYVEDIRKEVAGDGGYLNPRLTYLISQAQETHNRPALRGLLYYVLFKVTGSNDWLDQIRRVASRELISSWPTFSSLLKLQVFDVKDRADIMCQAYDKYISALPKNEVDARGVRQHLVDWGKSAVSGCRKPYLDQLHFLQLQSPDISRRRFAAWMYSQSEMLPLLDEPLEGMLIKYLKEYPDSKFDSIYPTRDLYFRRAGVPKDFIEAIMVGSGRQWLDQHKKLVDAWTTPGLPVLGHVSDNAMKKVLENIWISETELP